MIVPTIKTKRLTLRPHTLNDFPQYVEFLGSKRSFFMGGPHDANAAWSWFCNDVASWSLYRFGNLVITLTDTGETVGHAGITQGPEFPEPELGWLLFDGQERKGYAREAAAAIRDFGFNNSGLATIVSYIDVEDKRSINVAEKIGATRDLDAETPHNEPTLVFRHTKPAAPK